MDDLVTAFAIFARYPNFGIGAEHDQIFVYVSEEDLPPDSPDGKLLTGLNWFIQDGGWSKFV